MSIAMERLCIVFAKAFDIIEKEQLGASENHSMRVALMCIAMGRKLGYSDDAISAVTICGMFHDSALTEYHLSQQAGELMERNMILHCEKGQDNVAWLPFSTNIDNFITHHHERGDGKGPFKKTEGEISLGAALIAAADAVDATFHLQRVKISELPGLRERIARRAEIYSSRAAVDVLLEVLDEKMLESLRDDIVSETVKRELPSWRMSLDDPNVIRAGGFISRVIDYKSEFTRMHTSQIANRAWVMANHYGYGLKERNALFLAASLHDIGKIATPIGILEKPAALEKEEFEIIKLHVKNTLDWLSDIPDFENIANWGANHHEKLNGAGYSRGITADNLDFNSKLMACIDIYQAVSEPRPYHGARSHAATMAILFDMAHKGFVDVEIARDLNEVMAEYSLCEVPSPIECGEHCITAGK